MDNNIKYKVNIKEDIFNEFNEEKLKENNKIEELIKNSTGILGKIYDELLKDERITKECNKNIFIEKLKGLLLADQKLNEIFNEISNNQEDLQNEIQNEINQWNSDDKNKLINEFDELRYELFKLQINLIFEKCVEIFKKTPEGYQKVIIKFINVFKDKIKAMNEYIDAKYIN